MSGRVKAPARYVAQVERCLDQAAGRLGLKVPAKLVVRLLTVRHTSIVRGQYCAKIPRTGVVARGWCQSAAGIITIVEEPGGKLPDMTIRWECGRVLLWHAGVRDPAEQERRMNEENFRSWK